MNKSSWIPLLAMALLVSACGKSQDKPAETTASAPERAIAVTLTEAKAGAVPIVLEAVGDVQSIKAPTIGAEVAGRVTELLVDVGDVVAKGDALGQLDRSGILLELDVARAEQSRVKALTVNQELVVKRQHDLKKKSFVSDSAIDEAEAQLRALREQLKVAKAQVALAEYKLGKSTITAPFSGKIDGRFVSEGDYVKDGAPLFSIADTEALRLVMVFPEPAMGTLRKGTPLKVMTAVNPERRFDAAITEIRPQVESSNKGVVAYADLPDPGLTHAGASASVWATLAVHENAIVLPQLSLVRRPAGEVVYVVGADNRVSERKVVSGVRLEEGIEIVKGLQPGERVAVDGAGFLTDGTLVEVK
jgi:RND family efflux transporter MFP subunit